MQATNEPNDPLLASMRRNGTLMHPAFCRNGSRVPPELGNDVTQLLSFGPLWVGDDAAEALGLLRRAAALALAQQQQQASAVASRGPCVRPSAMGAGELARHFALAAQGDVG